MAGLCGSTTSSEFVASGHQPCSRFCMCGLASQPALVCGVFWPALAECGSPFSWTIRALGSVEFHADKYQGVCACAPHPHPPPPPPFLVFSFCPSILYHPGCVVIPACGLSPRSPLHTCSLLFVSCLWPTRCQEGAKFLSQLQVQTEQFWQFVGILFNIVFAVRRCVCAPASLRSQVQSLNLAFSSVWFPFLPLRPS
jgi:hypothetical protein